MNEVGEAVQVVTVADNHSYHLNEEELEKILMNEEVKDLPVVIVSVAGPYRSGKSFLLNFFIRYLTATPAACADGSWLGKDTEPLTGFNWRGGYERNTTGIVMWSKPFTRELQTGEKVVVLLMDTQGTFDNSSTVHDSSTIFSLSTLLSSIQIYNLTSSIKEDDLHQLQLLIDYAKLMKDQTAEAFQGLVLLVRDWMHVHEFRHGYVGGEKYLKKVFDVTRSQPTELKELRQHILTSFDKVRCCLMAHPGLIVAEPDFTGAYGEIRSMFKESLEELAPSILSSKNLTMKMIGGRPMKCRDLFSYFKTYMCIFNSDTVFSPMTILQATSEAFLMIVYNETYEQFENNMKRACGLAAPSMPSDDVINLHIQEMDAACTTFKEKALLGDPEEIKKMFETLKAEIENRLNEFLEINAAKTVRAKIRGFAAFEKIVEDVCVHPNDLTKIHEDAIEGAKKAFIKNRNVSAVDADRDQLIKELASVYSVLEVTNTHNNNTIVDEIKDKYFKFMTELCNQNPKPSPSALMEEHQKALARALEQFESRRNFRDNYTEDTFKSNLKQIILSQFKFMKPNNKGPFEKGLMVYNNNSILLSELTSSCLHPDDLEKKHEDAMDKALQAYRIENQQNVNCSNEDFGGNDELLLYSIMRSRYTAMVNANVFANNNAVDMGILKFKSEFVKLTVSWLTHTFGMTQRRRQYYFDRAMPFALDVFYGKRLNRHHYSVDIYLARLQSECKEYAQV